MEIRVRQVTWYLPLELYHRLEARAEKDSLPGPYDCAMRLLVNMLDAIEARETQKPGNDYVWCTGCNKWRHPGYHDTAQCDQ